MTAAPDGPRRVCLLTGAGGTLGAAFCAACSGEYDIAAVYRGRHPPVSSQEQWFVDPLDPGTTAPESRWPVYAIQADIAAPGEVERVVELALARFGTVDLLLNAAVRYEFGSTLSNPHVLDSAAEQFLVNTIVPARLAAALAEAHWRDRPDENRARNRAVVNVSSTSGIETYGGGQGVYAATKAALNALTRYMALDYAPIAVRVNALAPTAFPRLVATAKVVDAVLRLDSGDANGAVLVLDVDGERTL